MKLLTQAIRKRLPPFYSQEKVKDPIVQLKFFTPDSNWTWYIIEFDGVGNFFGWVDGPYGFEPGYVSLSELERARGPLGLHIERDMWFRPTPLSQVRKNRNPRRRVSAPRIWKTQCKRCGKEIYTGGAGISGAKELYAKYGQICEACTTPEEKAEMLRGQAGAIMKKMRNPRAGIIKAFKTKLFPNVYEIREGGAKVGIAIYDPVQTMGGEVYTWRFRPTDKALSRGIGGFSNCKTLQEVIDVYKYKVENNPTQFRCSVCGASAPKDVLRHGQLEGRMTWLRKHYQKKHPVKFQGWGKNPGMVRAYVHPEALEARKRYKADIRAGHKEAAEYWKGNAAGFFLANP